MSRPSLKITRRDDRQPPENVAFEVWDPITATYDPVVSLKAGLSRISELAEQVRQIWVRHDPGQASLRDAPDAAEDDDTEWAEFRVTAQARLSYETRNFDQRGWMKAMNRKVAVQTICNEIGYVPPLDAAEEGFG
jgi:hypothetical protein